MLSTAKKYHVNFAALAVSKDLKLQLPAWYHLGATSKRMGPRSHCLQRNHNSKRITDLIKITHRLEPPEPGTRKHVARCNCACISCAKDRENDCVNPHKCALEAKARLTLFPPKTDPAVVPLPDGLTLTPTRLTMNRAARKANGTVLFDPSVTCRTTLAECFRIFTDPAKITNRPATRLSKP
ncbi:hypothetical protein BV25DRAFT_1763480, partial [Artomyces pyxidatus]